MRTRTLLGTAVVCGLLIAASSTRAQPGESAYAAERTVLAPLDASEPVTFFVAAGEAGSAYRSTDAELAVWALDAWARSANGMLRFTPASEANALLRIYWVPANYGQYGEMRPIVVAGKRGAMLFIRPDTDALGTPIAQLAREDPLFRDAIVYLTCLHELGHALGLEHTASFEDIMYYFGYGGDIVDYFDRYRRELDSRDDIANVTGLSDADLATLRALYGVR